MSTSKITDEKGRCDVEKFFNALWKRIWDLSGDYSLSQMNVDDYALWLKNTLHDTKSEAVMVVCYTLLSSAKNWSTYKNDSEFFSCVEACLTGLMQLLGIRYDEEEDEFYYTTY